MSTDAYSRPLAQPPTVATAPPNAWDNLLRWLLLRGQATLASLGLLLLAGFGLGLGALWLFAAVADGVLERDTLVLDQGVLVAMQSHANSHLDRAAFLISMLGAEILAVLLFGVLLWLAWSHRFGAALSLLLAVGGAQLLNNVLKLLFERPRPAPVITGIPGQAWSFPSGHAMVSLAFYGFLAYLGWQLLRGRWRGVWLAFLSGLVLLIGLSRMYLGVHYPTDVFAGYVAGFIWLDTIIIGGHLLARRRAQAGLAPVSATPVAPAPARSPSGT